MVCAGSPKRPHWFMYILTDGAGEMTYYQEQRSWIIAREVQQGGAVVGSHSSTGGGGGRRGQGQQRKPPMEASTATRGRHAYTVPVWEQRPLKPRCAARARRSLRFAKTRWARGVATVPKGLHYSAFSGLGICKLSCRGQRWHIHGSRDQRRGFLERTLQFRSHHRVCSPKSVATAQSLQRQTSCFMMQRAYSCHAHGESGQRERGRTLRQRRTIVSFD